MKGTKLDSIFPASPDLARLAALGLSGDPVHEPVHARGPWRLLHRSRHQHQPVGRDVDPTRQGLRLEVNPGRLRKPEGRARQRPSRRPTKAVSLKSGDAAWHGYG